MRIIRKHPTVREIYADQLAAKSIIEDELGDQLDKEIQDNFKLNMMKSLQ